MAFNSARYDSFQTSPYLYGLGIRPSMHSVTDDAQYGDYRNSTTNITGRQDTTHIGQEPKDPWKMLNDLVEKHDNGECRNWSEEIQNLLIFTGLFAATVTAFVVESCQWLQDGDYDDNTTKLLSAILNVTSTAIQNEGIILSSEAIDVETGTKPYQVRVNIFWFSSLILSLSTVLIGILCLQWLREFQRDAAMLPKDAIPIRQLRYRGLKAWRVPQIISALPILLQVAVILFFIGILDLLWTLNRTVAGIVTCVVAFPLIVLFFTAVAPALQAFTISTIDPQRIIAQCPYKSPQAWLFYLALQPSVRCLRFFSQSLSTLQAYWWSAREYGVKKCLRMMRRGHLMNSLRQKLREDFAWVLNENTGQFEAKEGWLELDHCWHEIQGGELLGIDTINGISWIIDHFGHRLDVFKSLDLALDDLDDKSVKMLVHKREKDDLSEFISGGDKECLSLFILHQLPIHQHERLRRYLIRRLVDCINKSPELSAKLFNSEDIIEPFFKYYCNNTKAFPNADERALMKCLIAFSAAKPHSHMPFWVLTHPLKLPSFNLIKEDGGLDDVQLQTCFHTLTLFGSLLDGGRRDHPGSAELLSSNSHRNWLGRCQKQLLALPINDDDRRKWQEQKVWGDMKSLIDLVDEQLAQHWPEGRTEDWAQWVGDATGRDATTSVVHTPVYRHKLPSDVIDREREATGLSREESGPGGHGHYSIRNGYLNEPSGQNPGPDSSSHRYSSLRSADPDLDTNELTRYTSFRRGS